MALPWSFVSKNTNSKHQNTNKSQTPIFNEIPTTQIPSGDNQSLSLLREDFYYGYDK
jgi:hypothetical protein